MLKTYRFKAVGCIELYDSIGYLTVGILARICNYQKLKNVFRRVLNIKGINYGVSLFVESLHFYLMI